MVLPKRGKTVKCYCLTANRILISVLILVFFLSTMSATERVSEVKSSNIYVGIEGGVSISNRVLLAPEWTQKDCISNIWYPTGSDSFDTDLGTAKCIGAKIGYQINPVVSVDFTYNYLGDFSSLRGYASNIIASTTFILGDIYSFRNISIQTFLFNINLSPDIQWGGVVPYISGGAGFASNKIGCMKNYNEDRPDVPPLYDITLNAKRITCFSWQAGIGAYYVFHSHWRFGMAYRFLDVGKLATGDYYHYYSYNPVSEASGITKRFVARHPTFNEFLLSLTYDF